MEQIKQGGMGRGGGGGVAGGRSEDREEQGRKIEDVWDGQQEGVVRGKAGRSVITDGDLEGRTCAERGGKRNKRNDGNENECEA